MIKDVEYHQQQQQNPNYPTQMPSAPPTYDEVMHNNNVTATPGNPPYPNVTTYPNTAPYPNAAPYPSSMPYPQQPVINPPSATNATGPTVIEVQLAPSYLRRVKCIPGNDGHAFVHDPGYVGQSTAASDALVIHSGTVVAALGPVPAHVTCPHCRYVVVTSTETEPNCAAHLCCLLLLVIGCCPFSSLPYCMDSLKNVRHFCPNCKAFLGSYQP